MQTQNRNVWDYIIFGWIFIWILVAVILFFIFDPVMVASIGFALVPFLICGFFIPYYLIRAKSNLSFTDIINWIIEVETGKSKKIRYLCIFSIPATLLFFLYLLKYPESYLEYGPQYTKQFVYNLAFLQFLYLVAYIGYFNEKKWGLYLYTGTSVFGLLIMNYGFGINVSGISNAWNLFVIFYGLIYMPNSRKKKL